MATPISDLDLSGRLDFLIKRDFGGNLYKAARAWRVPQPTLHRYVQRGTRSPNAGTLLKIARFYDTTVEWLLEGIGNGPGEPAIPFVEFKGWEYLVKDLDLPADAERIVMTLPGRIGVANTVLCDWGLFNWKGKTVAPKRRGPGHRAVWAASAMELQAWALWLRAVIETYGRDAVRNKLLSEMDRVRLGFQRFAIFLYNTDRVAKDLSGIYDREFHQPGQPVGTVLIDHPKTPPLNAIRR